MSRSLSLRTTTAVVLASIVALGAPMLTAASASAEALLPRDEVASQLENDAEIPGRDVADAAETDPQPPESAPIEAVPDLESSTPLETDSAEIDGIEPTLAPREETVSGEDQALAPVDGGTLSWGIIESWRNYITGPIAKGEFLSVAPATLNPDRSVTWVDGAGEVDLDAGTGVVEYAGGLTARGHHGLGPNGGWALNQTLSTIRIELTSPTTATLSAEVEQPLTDFAPEYRGERVEMADLTFAAGDLSDGQVTATGVLTEAGADVYSRMNDDFAPGAPVEDVRFGIGVEAPDSRTPTSITVEATPSTVYADETVALTASVEPAIAGTVTFMSGNAVLGEPVKSDRGAAKLSPQSFSVGSHRITARFVPDDQAYRGSTSRPTVVEVAQRPATDAVAGSMQWGIKQSFREYVVGAIAKGKFTSTNGAAQARSNGVFTYPQARTGTSWNGTTGHVQYAGNVNVFGHAGAMNVNISNPKIMVLSASKAELVIPFGSAQRDLTVASIDLSRGKTEQLDGGATRFVGAEVTLSRAGAEQVFVNATDEGPSGGFYAPGETMDRITFTIGEGTEHAVKDPPKSAPKPKSEKRAEPRAAGTAGGAAGAGSLRWGVSQYFADYTSKKSGAGCPTPSRHCAGGTIETSGVGGGWLFPQAEGSDWDQRNQTGTVKFSGVVSFKGYGMTMFQVANPSITVNSASSATLNTGNTTSYGKASYALDLSGASKSVGPNGEVTWSNVPVSGSLMGLNASQSIGFDNLTFTVGDPSRVSYGATQDGDDGKQYTAAATPPTTEGLEVLTPADKIREGGRIEAQASGFEPEDDGVLVVLYTDPVEGEPMVLDDGASADESGVVTWSGTLPKEGTGDHVLTFQGSTDAGAKIEILEPDERASADTVAAVTAAGGGAGGGGGIADLIRAGGMAPWEWWASAGALLAIAACTSLLVVRQRRELAAAPQVQLA